MPSSADPVSEPFVVEVHDRLADIGREAWDRLVGRSPFLEFDFLSTLEETGCVSAKTGWSPRHLTVRAGDGGEIVGGAATYLKQHSMGEYVFDHAWADAAQRAGLSYYPKLLVAAPFTPVVGERLLVAPDVSTGAAADVRRALGQALVQLAEAANLSSIHVNFCDPADRDALADTGYIERTGYQYVWQNTGGWESWDEWIGGALRAKRRKEVRRERRAVADAGVRVEMVAGEAIDEELMRTMFRLYARHLRLYGMWGRRYLSEEAFVLLGERWRNRLALAVARRDDDVVGGALHVVKGDAMYGRYWGAFDDVPFLHFECCYYAAIEHCLRQGIRRFEAGAQGDFKRNRGLDAQPTRSMHHLAYPPLRRAVADFLRRERQAVDETVDVLRAHTAAPRREPEGSDGGFPAEPPHDKTS